MQQLKLLQNVFNVFYQDLSSQSQSLDPHVLVFRRTVSTLTHTGAGRLNYEIPEEHLMYFKSLCFAWNHGTTIQTVITCKHVRKLLAICATQRSGGLLQKKLKYFEIMLSIFEFLRV